MTRCGNSDVSTNSSPRSQPKNDDSLKPTDIVTTGKHKGGKRKTGVRVVEIEWIDAVAVGGDDWTDESDLDIYGMPSLSIGYVINENDEAITIVALANLSHYGHGITIPKGCIVAVRNIH